MVTMMRFLARFGAGHLFLILLLRIPADAATTAHAQDEAVWPVDGKLIGKDDHKSRDVSGVACSTVQGFPRACMVIDDELQAAQMVTLKDGEIEAGESVPLISNTYDDGQKTKKLELDGERVAYGDGFYYVVGSHGYPRHASDDSAFVSARIDASSQIVRVGLTPDGTTSIERSAKLRDFIEAEPELKPFVAAARL